MLPAIFFSLANGLVFLSIWALLVISTDRVAHGFVIQRSIVPVVAAPRQETPDRVLRRVSGDDSHEGCKGSKDGGSVSGSSTTNESSDVESHEVVHTLLPKSLPKHIWNSVVERQRREKERLLLAQVLEEGDEALQKLRDFWGSQCDDTEQTELLYQAARVIGDPKQWNSSKRIFETLCKENPTFLEPFARLSKLYCLMGKIEESQDMALAVLQLKPWHVLAIETMVATSYALGNVESSVHWASQRLPPPNETQKRNEWIHRAIQASLELETKGASEQEESSGDEDIPTVEKDAWQ